MFGLGLGKLGNNYKVHLRRKRGFFPPGTPQAIREALVCWYDPARQGCTNESMAENPVLKDLSGNGRDLALHNFAWSGMSGIGGYHVEVPMHDSRYAEKLSDYKYRVRLVVGANINIVWFTGSIPAYRIKVTGLQDGQDLRCTSTENILIKKDGTYSIPAWEDGNPLIWKGLCGNTYKGELDVVVEFLPDYPNALVGDGVDDYCKAEGLPMLTDYTVIAKHTNTFTTSDISWKAFYNKGSAKNNGAFKFHRLNRNNYRMEVLSFNGSNYPLDFTDDLVTVITKETYNGQPIKAGTATDGELLRFFSSGSSYADFALWSFLLFSRTLSEEEIEWVKANMVNSYPSPVAYYDCSKYSNGDMGDNPVLEDLSGNGNDLELHNFAFGGMSGFGGYDWNFNNFIRATYPHTDSTVRFDLSNPPDSYANEFTGYINPSSVPAVLKGVKIKVSGIASSSFNLYCQINLLPSGSVRKDIVVDKDGTYEFPDVDLSQYEKINNVYYGISHLDTPASDIIDVELIPEYPGGLVFDGVDDYGLIKSIEGFKTVFMLMVYCNNTNVYYNQQIYDHSGGANIPAFRVRYAFTNRLNVDDTDYLESYINGIKNIDTLTTLDCVAKKILVTNVSDRRLTLNDGKIFPVTNSPCCILYKFLGFKERLSQKQMDKVIQDYRLMEGVDDVWNENNN